MDSILTSVKSLLGIDAEYAEFDSELILFINAVFTTLRQLNVGPEDGFKIQNADQTWNEFMGDTNKLEIVKTYVGLKVRNMFDPPSSSAVVEAFNTMTSEMEWRILRETDVYEEEVVSDDSGS